MRRSDITPDDLIQQVQDLAARLIVADASASPRAALQRAAETVHLMLDDNAIREALQEAALRYGGRDRNFLADLLSPYESVKAI